ncbi:MAG: LamG-like jellyroll fold domain-containing protein, partial [Pseudomonadota bacterium]
ASTEYDPVAVAYVSEDGPSYAISLLAQKDGLAILFGEEEELVLFDFSDGQAHHVAVSVYTDGTEVSINGEFVATFDMTPPAIEGAAFLIGSAVDNTDPFVGSIGAMRMWDVPLRPQYITNYRLRPLLSEELGDHPDIESLNAFSEFSEGDFFMVDSAEVE